MKRRKMSDEIAAFAIATGSTTLEAAKKAGVSPRTIDRWLATPSFRTRINEIRSEILERATGKLVSILTCAIETFRTLLSSESDHVRLGAARSIVETAVKYHEVLNLDERVKRLEEGESQGPDRKAGAE